MPMPKRAPARRAGRSESNSHTASCYEASPRSESISRADWCCAVRLQSNLTAERSRLFVRLILDRLRIAAWSGRSVLAGRTTTAETTAAAFK
jgi:hypothetical protein